MIITKTPFRISFLGGGSDFPAFFQEHGGSVISTTFDKYCYVIVRHLPRFFTYSTELAYSKIERVNSVEEIQHPAIREAMKYMNIQDIRLTYEADLPARSGLGTSSSFAVGMLNAFYALKGEIVDKKKLADEAIILERDLCKEAGGIQDQIAATFGGFNRIDFNADGYTVKPLKLSQERSSELNKKLILFFTGFSRYSSDIQIKLQTSLKDKVPLLLEMIDLVNEAEKMLTGKCDLSNFGYLLDYSWNLKRGLTNNVSNEYIDILYSKAKNAGALGGKLLGAGGGGFLLLYVEQDKIINVKTALEKLLHVPFLFENVGTKRLYCQKE